MLFAEQQKASVAYLAEAFLLVALLLAMAIARYFLGPVRTIQQGVHRLVAGESPVCSIGQRGKTSMWSFDESGKFKANAPNTILSVKLEQVGLVSLPDYTMKNSAPMQDL